MMQDNKQALTFDDHLAGILALNNVNVDEYNELADQFEALQSRNMELVNSKKQLEAENKEAAEILNLAKNELEFKQVEKTKATDQLGEQKDLLARFKEIGNTPKKIREKIKSLQENVAKWRNTSDAQKKELNAYRKEIKQLKQNNDDLLARIAQSSLFAPLQYENGDILAVWPRYYGTKQEISMLYMSNSGRGALMSIDEDGEVNMSPSPKGGLRPTKRCQEDANTILSRFKRQKWEITDEDIKWFRANSAVKFDG